MRQGFLIFILAQVEPIPLNTEHYPHSVSQDFLSWNELTLPVCLSNTQH